MRQKGCTEKELKRIVSAQLEAVRSVQAQIKEAEEDEKRGIQKYPADNSSIIRSAHAYCFKSREGLISAMYSLGQKIDSLLPHFNGAVLDLENSYLHEEYSPAHSMWGDYEALIDIVSLGILLEADNETMQKIADAMYYHNMDDALIDFLLSACNIGWTHQTIKYYMPNPYKFAGEIIIAAQEDKSQAVSLLETYIKKKWKSEDGWSYESAAVAKILGLDDSRLKDNSHYPYELVHYKNQRKFPDSSNFDWLKRNNKNQQGAECLEREKEFIRNVEKDYETLGEQEFYEKYRERFLMELFSDITSYRNFRKEQKNEILGYLLVYALVTDGYILQMDFKDEPEEYLIEFVNERLETDYNEELIEMEDADSSQNMEVNIQMYHTKYVKTLQRKLKRKGFCLVWFLLGDDQYYVAIVPEKTALGTMWKGIRIVT